MTTPTQIRQLFVSDVTRDIPPVVYFHEQTPDKLLAEVGEYIFTGGWPKDHPNHRRVPDGIHEQYVRLLTAIMQELSKPGGPDLPAVWISGFYGSGKSSFAKLLGLALDGAALPDGRSLAEAWLARNSSPRAAELARAWQALRQKVEPLAVVFDIGGSARSGEHVHSAILRQVQKRLGYCDKQALVADYELKLERDGEWQRFLTVAEQHLGRPWEQVRQREFAEDDFSAVLHALFPERYPDPLAWINSRAGTHSPSASPEEVVEAIRDMLKYRRPGATLFIVVDEVSQYVHSVKDRSDRLRAFASALGAGLKGKAWLLALGQERLDAQAGTEFAVWVKDRFPPKLRVHLESTNIQDVVHQRLLKKTPAAEQLLRQLFEQHRPELKLYAYGCDSTTPEEFIEVYPMLPGHITLLLQITTALRTRSTRAQGDDQAIRGLLQLLGELFRAQNLAEQPIGALVTLDQIYEIQHTALDTDVQNSMARVLNQCRHDPNVLLTRAAKAVALLELIQDTQATSAQLVAQCLYASLDQGDQSAQVTAALEELKRRNLLSYSEKQGYKLQSSAGEEWERTRSEFPTPREQLSELIQEALKLALAGPERPRLHNRPFPWAGYYSDGRAWQDGLLANPRDEAAFLVDFRYLTGEERGTSAWINRSAELALENRLVWVAEQTEAMEDTARRLIKSQRMVDKYRDRRESLNPARKLLFDQEKTEAEDLRGHLGQAVEQAWMNGAMYFRGRQIKPVDHGTTFNTALHACANRLLPELYHRAVETQILPAELQQLLDKDISGPSPRFLKDHLGLLEQDGGNWVPTCSGVVPRRLLEKIEADGGLSGETLLRHFGGPPYGYTVTVVKACVVGLLRAQKVKLQAEDGTEITAIRDASVKDIFITQDRAFRRATIVPAGEDDIGVPARARICKFFEQRLGRPQLQRQDDAIADAVTETFPELAVKLRTVLGQLNRLPNSPDTPKALVVLTEILEQGIRGARQTAQTVKLVKRHLDALNDGVQLLNTLHAELSEPAITAVIAAAQVRDYQGAQLQMLASQSPESADAFPPTLEAAMDSLKQHLQAPAPWRDIGALAGPQAQLLAAYRDQRQALLNWQEAQTEEARSRVKRRDGFSTLTGVQAHQVLKPLDEASTETSAEAVAPPLSDLRDGFTLALKRAEQRAHEALDQLLSQQSERQIVPLDLSLHNRELRTPAEVEALVAEIRQRLLAQLQTGTRIRLL